ncbi:DNA primase [Sedimentibacter sp. zth1]|uniref:DNA primase n=1 Tax=Sedimentibacter sp. zth1 TaxID=2816908 RepID=UPI001A9119D4|nr:DNA primase [Sedimentibacter sp. zth1]QSX06830.1 DNA primase [Sedimentibacter sp. zth1]
MPYNITEEKKQQIIDSNDIVDVIEEFIPLKKNGTNYTACCPFHKEKTPSFVVSKEKQIYHCFGCGESGDSIKFLMEYSNLTFIEAIENLAKRANITLEEVNYSKEVLERNKLDNRLYQINKDAAYYFYNNLLRNKIPLNYLNKRDVNENIIKKFGIGYTVNQWDSLINHLVNKGYSKSDIAKTGLIIRSEKTNNYYDRFRNRVMFPIVDVRQRVIGFGGRIMDNSSPKYLNSPDSAIFSKGYNLYGLNIAKEHVKDKYFYLVEGYMDVIKMHAYGFDTAIAALGTAFTQNQINLLKRYSHKFYICFDSDSAGLKASLKAINMFKRNNLEAKVIIVKGAKDPDEFLNKYGKTKFEMLASSALDYYRFLNFYYKNEFNSSNKMDYINKFMENLVNVNSDIEKELTIEKLSLDVGVSKESLMNEYRKKYNNKSNNFSSVKNNKVIPKALTINKSSINTSHEEELIKLILKNDDLALTLDEIIKDADFSKYAYLDIFRKIYQAKLTGIKITKDFFKEINTETVNLDNVFKDIEITEDNLNSLFNDCYKRLKIRYLVRLQSNKNIQLTKINDYALQKSEMKEISRLAKKIKSLKEEVS